MMAFTKLNISTIVLLLSTMAVGPVAVADDTGELTAGTAAALLKRLRALPDEVAPYPDRKRILAEVIKLATLGSGTSTISTDSPVVTSLDPGLAGAAA